ncbi:hypothetical protein [Microtetraspora sp. NBRC 13810]|uniref:hypothetical protein n=1 Tax=Microtetraspora sp. NBRC 13810 TaxID=3030990 RepID=UPI00255415BF|nr:hypothetical protein [Microtetraspora sp. NBRC 13810]
MPSNEHEALIQLFRNRPSLATELLREALHVPVPDHNEATIESTEFSDVTPTQYRADAVVVLSAAGKAVLAVVVEVQRKRDPDKRWTWPVYLATLRKTMECPAVLLVVCTNDRTAAWCGTAIEMGHPGWTLTPLVAGPKSMPAITDPQHAARAPELAVLSARAHGSSADGFTIVKSMISALPLVDDQFRNMYCDIVLPELPEDLRLYVEKMLKSEYQYQSNFFRDQLAESKAEGQAEGEAQALLLFLSARGIEVPEEARARISGCADLAQLQEWIQRAATVETADELFA